MFLIYILNLPAFKQRVVTMERETYNDTFGVKKLNKFSVEVRKNVLAVYFVICATTFAMLSYVFLVLKQSDSFNL